ncbi:MAG: hypothetical protein KDD60_11770, partial [Bdellovibrionales bacterium]|nr:hypothetical protein [Bdellovibrionales bacterium]
MNRSFSLTLYSITSLLFASSVSAQTQDPQSLEALSASIRDAGNITIALNADDDFAAGRYRFKNTDSPDADMDIFRLAPEFPLAEKFSHIEPLLELSASYLNISQDVPIPFPSTDADNLQFDVWSFGAGLGARIFLSEEYVRLIPRMRIVYSRFESSYDFRSPETRAELQPILGEAVDFDFTAWTYAPSLELEIAQVPFNDFLSFSFSSRADYLYTDSDRVFNRQKSFDSEASIWRNAVYLDFLTGIEFYATPLTLR